jgi:hypothetical protein
MKVNENKTIISIPTITKTLRGIKNKREPRCSIFNSLKIKIARIENNRTAKI